MVAACSSDGKELEPPEQPLPPGVILGDAAAPGTESTLVDGPLQTLPPEPLQLLAAWPDAAVLPERHTCADVGASPALAWTVAPAGTAEMAISALDLTDGRAVVWLVEAIDPATGAIGEGTVPDGAVVRVNDAGETAWDAPCPPDGELHEILFTVYALAQQVELPADVAPADVVAAYEAAAIDRASITATVQLGL